MQWFPGHMQRARREIQESLATVDVVLEVIDARAPRTSSNPDLADIAAGKPRVMILNKADLADAQATLRWCEYLRRIGQPAVAMDAVSGFGKVEVLAAVRALFQPVLVALVKRGRLPRPARAMVVGMPNLGKSSVINRLVGGRRARTGSRPGVTRGRQWVRASLDIELLDFPGVLVPKFLDARAGSLMAALGAVKEEVFSPEAVVAEVLPALVAVAPALVVRWGGFDAQVDPLVNLRRWAGEHGYLRPGGAPDSERAAVALLKDLRTGRLGRLSFEYPPVG